MMKTFADISFKPESTRKGAEPIASANSVEPVLASNIYRKATCACGGSCPSCQSKSSDLKISHPNDPAELEADRTADRVMRMPIGNDANKGPEPIYNRVGAADIHRKCDACEEDLEEPVMRKEKGVVADARPETPPGSGDNRPSINSVLRSGGASLDYATREFFEPRFGIDLGHVRIHTGGDASRSARSINSRAYTLGHDIVFASGEYRPASDSGRYLLAHELAHVAQQPNTIAVNRSAWPSTPSVDCRTIYRAPDDLDDLFESPSQGGEGHEAGGGGGGSTNALGCPKVPTKLGDLTPEPSCPTATHIGTNEVARINFCLDSDRPIDPADLTQIAAIVSRNHPKTHFLVHGYASPEGNKKYNFNLACHRANRIAEAFFEPIRAQVLARPGTSEDPVRANKAAGAEFLARVETAAQGPTNKFGKPEENRLVIVYAQRPRTVADEEPSCDDVHGKIGDIKPELAPDLATVNLNGSTPDDHRAHFRFCKDSDVLKGMTPADVRKFAHAQASKAVFIVHGFASPEGDAEYNRRLSHHRALRIARELINAGVRPEQVREVSAIGETDKFGDDDANRVAVVEAQGGAVDEFEDSKHEAKTAKQKQAVIDEARGRLIAGEYNLEADAYISFWTCGRTKTVSEAVERLTIRPRNTDERETLPDRANGAEEGEGANNVIISNVAMQADNGVECTMGRLVDMAFHHSEIDNPDLPSNFASRHSAGLHLIHLAGLGQCLGKDANPTVQLGNQKGGIDKPIKDDPRKNTPIPACAETPEATRLHFPTKGAEGRERPHFDFAKQQPEYIPARGKLTTNFKPGNEANSRILLTSQEKDLLTAKAEIQLVGDPATFSDYEVGFIQSVIADETQADYDSGHSVIQGLPVPIRHAHLRDEVPVPAPWTTLDSMAVPGPDGKVSLSTSSIKSNSEFAISLGDLDPALPKNSVMSTFEVNTRIAIWLIARRRGAPLDRFSIHFIDGRMYDVTQIGHLEHRHARGEMFGFGPGGSLQTVRPSLGGEGEIAAYVGGFLTGKPTEMPADPSEMRFHGAVSSDIRLLNQVKKIVKPSVPGATAMGKAELTAAVTEILDNLEVFPDAEAAAKKNGGKKVPRLGFDFIPLKITLPFVISTGRLQLSEAEKVPKVEGPGLGGFAAFHIARALEFRIHHRGAPGDDVIVQPSILSGGGEIGTVVINIPARPRDPKAPASEESDLLKRPEVLKIMAEAWECTELTKKSIDFGTREFALGFAMDRDKVIHSLPKDRLQMGEPEAPDGSFTTILPCAGAPDQVNLGSFHTHPIPDPIPPEPSDKDTRYFTETCPAGQHFIVTDNRVFRVSPDGKSTTEVLTLPKAPGCHAVNLEEKDGKKKTDEDEL